VLEVTARTAAGSHDDVRAEEDRRYQPAPPLGMRVDVALDQSDQIGGALGMADQHDSAAVVVAGEVVKPGRQDVPVALRQHPVVAGVRQCPSQPARLRGRRELAVHRRPHSAGPGEAGRLLDRDRLLLGLNLEVCVQGRLVAHRRVHVEAVDRRSVTHEDH
jgi:hypothetical protein